MNAAEIKNYIIENLKDKLKQFEINSNEIKKDFDFVQSGLLDSMAFVEMIAGMEQHFNIEIDFEKIDEDDGFTTLSGINELFLKAK
ncbi:MAG: acyl carrier protein [Bacteroidales bacterium]|nr:acyl carrier protein [Bacteroidales bacterium]